MPLRKILDCLWHSWCDGVCDNAGNVLHCSKIVLCELLKKFVNKLTKNNSTKFKVITMNNSELEGDETVIITNGLIK